MTITDHFLAGYSSFINDRIFHVSGDVVLATDLHHINKCINILIWLPGAPLCVTVVGYLVKLPLSMYRKSLP